MSIFIMNLRNCLKRIFLNLISNSLLILLFVLKYLKRFIRLINFYYILCLFKALCFLLLIYTSVLVTLDFFSYPYIFKLNVNNNINGSDLPPISFCTETNVLFDKNKFISFFNSSQEFRDFRVKEVENYEMNRKQNLRNLLQYGKRVDPDPNKWEVNWFWYLYFPQYPYPKETFDKRIEFFGNLSFDRMKDLMIRANDVIDCSAKLHSRYDSKEITIENCVQDFNVLESIYGNKDFGICFTFFHSNEKFYLKDDDYIEFQFRYSNGPDFTRNSFFEFNSFNYKRFIDDNVVIYAIVNQNTKYFETIKENAIKLSRQGLEGELKFTTTKVNYITIPYMSECKHYGKCFYILIYSINM